MVIPNTEALHSTIDAFTVLFQLEALDVCGQRGLSVEVSDWWFVL